jgi:hypothetical protein
MDRPAASAGQLDQQSSRRAFLGRAAWGLGSIALGALLGPRAFADGGATPASQRWGGVIHPLHYPPRAKRVIWLGQMGGPSQLETFDFKPKLLALDGQPMPPSFTQGQQIAQLQGQALRILAPQYRFSRHGTSQQEISELFPHLSTLADDLCIVRSLQSESINHDPAQLFMNTGSSIGGRPAMGSWLNYGLGSVCDDLPGFVVLTSVGGGQGQPIASRQWHSGFLPSRFQGVPLHSKGDPVNYVRTPAGVPDASQQSVIDSVQRLDAIGSHLNDDPELMTRISQYEMAARMQASVPELMDLRAETPATLAAYGAAPGDGSYASNCLLARRLVERGVRFVQLYHRDWDHHSDIKSGIAVNAKLTDQATAALIRDLKDRGMLKDTLVVWGGEFGRTPMAQGSGRDHHIKGFSMVLCGGGIRSGITYGATDELGYNAVEDVVSVHDLHATMLRLLGIDHLRFTYRFQGRDLRLTDVAGRVIDKILA